MKSAAFAKITDQPIVPSSRARLHRPKCMGAGAIIAAEGTAAEKMKR